MKEILPFHLAIPVQDIEKSKNFYKEVLECSEGRSSSTWVDLNFFGHQLVLHKKENLDKKEENTTNLVDSKNVPIPHFGVVLTISIWKKLAENLKNKEVKFIIDPYIRFEGEAGEQATMFFLDPSGNAIEFKAFQDIANQLFAR
ncbi:VOC family protein [Tenacibaculum sp. C7A-26P2]|uniref:VOC family protein n=1 Tax=Tenacibaculum sp. C7A-26P2 TaxID=3447504 RepID=UPI003F83C052